MLITLRVIMPAGNTIKTKLMLVEDDANLLDKFVRPRFTAELTRSVTGPGTAGDPHAHWRGARIFDEGEQ